MKASLSFKWNIHSNNSIRLTGNEWAIHHPAAHRVQWKIALLFRGRASWLPRESRNARFRSLIKMTGQESDYRFVSGWYCFCCQRNVRDFSHILSRVLSPFISSKPRHIHFIAIQPPSGPIKFRSTDTVCARVCVTDFVIQRRLLRISDEIASYIYCVCVSYKEWHRAQQIHMANTI